MPYEENLEPVHSTSGIPPHNDEQLASDTALDFAASGHDPLAGPKRPDITPAQIIGLIPLVANAAHAFGVFSINEKQQESLEMLLLGGIALFGADAIIRFGRNLASRL